MKALSLLVAGTATMILIASCSSSNRENGQTEKAELSREINSLSSSAAEESLKDSARKFIRTSDIKFRVKDVAQATYQIEDITRNFNGFVTYTHLETTTEEKKVTRMSLDSSLETIRYTVVNNMTIRVPNIKLDSTLKAIAGLVDFLEYRTIKADDVALQIKSNLKTQQRAIGNSKRIRTAIDNKSQKLNDVTPAESMATDRQKDADEAEIANLALLDQINYSTVSLALYQRTETKQSVIANDESEKYRPGMGLRLWDSVKSGWNFAEDAVVVFTRLWIFILLAIGGWLIYRKYRSKKVLAKA